VSLYRPRIRAIIADFSPKLIVFAFCSPVILFRIMARRPRPPDEVLNRKDLGELQRRLSMMSVTAVQDFYQSTHLVCRIGPDHFPSARAIQELVQAWKQMRKWR
jgi:hypothetical protein